MQETIVSIVLPTCNRAEMLDKAIKSVLEQSFDAWELIVVDDISTDRTEELMRNYEKEDSRIHYFRIPVDDRPGISKYLNFGIEVSKGKYIARLDDDDYWIFKDKLKYQVDFLDAKKDYVITGGGVIMLNSKNKPVFKYLKKENDSEIRKTILFANPFCHPSVMFRKDIAKQIGMYKDCDFAEDWDFFLRIGLVGKLYNFQKYFVCYLSAGQNKSFIYQRAQSKAIIKLIEEYKDYYPNYSKARLVNTLQYLYSFTPFFIRKRLQTFMYFAKRRIF